MPLPTIINATTNAAAFLNSPSSATLRTAVADGTGTGATVFANTPTLIAPVLGTPTSGTLTNCTLPVGQLTGAGTGVLTALAVNVGSAGAPVVNGGALGTPSSGVATNLTGTASGLTAGAASAVAVGGITGLGSGVGTFLATPSGANLATALTTALPATKGGTGLTALGTGIATALGVNVGTDGAPVVKAGALGTPSSGTLSSCSGLPIGSGLSGLGTGIATSLAVNVGTDGAPVVKGGALGTPSSGDLSNCTGFPASGAWVTKTANYSAVAGDQIIANTVGGTFTITFPASPSTGDVIWIAVVSVVSFVTADGNGKDIEGSPTQGTQVVNVYEKQCFVYNGVFWYRNIYAALAGLANSGAVVILQDGSTAPTQAANDNSLKVASTAYVDAAIAAYLSGPGTLAAILSAAGITPVADGTVTPVTSISTTTGIPTAIS